MGNPSPQHSQVQPHQNESSASETSHPLPTVPQGLTFGWQPYSRTLKMCLLEGNERATTNKGQVWTLVRPQTQSTLFPACRKRSLRQRKATYSVKHPQVNGKDTLDMM